MRRMCNSLHSGLTLSCGRAPLQSVRSRYVYLVHTLRYGRTSCVPYWIWNRVCVGHELTRSTDPFCIRGVAQSIDESECSRPRSASRIQTPPLQRCTHRTPGCAPLKRRRHSPARSTCAAAPVLRSSPLGADMVRKSRNSFADVLFTPGLLALMPPTICCVRSQSVSDLVTEISGGATPAPVRCGSEL